MILEEEAAHTKLDETSIKTSQKAEQELTVEPRKHRSGLRNADKVIAEVTGLECANRVWRSVETILSIKRLMLVRSDNDNAASVAIKCAMEAAEGVTLDEIARKHDYGDGRTVKRATLISGYLAEIVCDRMGISLTERMEGKIGHKPARGLTLLMLQQDLPEILKQYRDCYPPLKLFLLEFARTHPDQYNKLIPYKVTRREFLATLRDMEIVKSASTHIQNMMFEIFMQTHQNIYGEDIVNKMIQIMRIIYTSTSGQYEIARFQSFTRLLYFYENEVTFEEGKGVDAWLFEHEEYGTMPLTINRILEMYVKCRDMDRVATTINSSIKEGRQTALSSTRSALFMGLRFLENILAKKLMEKHHRFLTSDKVAQVYLESSAAISASDFQKITAYTRNYCKEKMAELGYPDY